MMKPLIYKGNTNIKITVILICAIIIQQFAKAQYAPLPPFRVRIEAVQGINIPGLHSFAFAEQNGKWLFIGGRTNGLHGVNSNDGFPSEFKNDKIMVVDTATWQYYEGDLNTLPLNIADPMRSNNMQYIQNGNYLYMVGGFGYDSVVHHYVTFPTITAIRIDSIINQVMNQMPFASSIRQVIDTNLRVCGGDIGKLGNDYFLVMGHDFEGTYADPPVPIFTQQYMNRVKKFSLSDNDTTITVSNFTFQTDTTNFHRRDFNLGPIIKPTGAEGYNVYGGVFQKHHNFPFLEPVEISSATANIDTTFHQAMSQYTCALLPVYDSLKLNMYTTFFGGISFNDFNHTTALVENDTLVPFIDDITTVTHKPTGVWEESVMPATMNGRIGANAKFIVNRNLPLYPNDVVKLCLLQNNQTVLAGYIFGGIRANVANLGVSAVNDSIYRVYFTYYDNTGVGEINSNIISPVLYPNPALASANLSFSLLQADEVKITITDVQGKQQSAIINQELNQGNHELIINTTKLAAGTYICNIITKNSPPVHLQLIH